MMGYKREVISELTWGIKRQICLYEGGGKINDEPADDVVLMRSHA